jgi:squalene-hopene/tetraprenyl-beta-curcumene cyclase
MAARFNSKCVQRGAIPMNSTLQRIAVLTACFLAGIIALYLHAETRADGSKTPKALATHPDQPETKIASSWNQKSAAAYLDQRATWWMEWPKSARDHETFCISCHTAVPYAISRPALRKSLAESSPSPNERRLLANVTKRVRLWKEVEPFYKDADRGVYKSVESRGTESVLNALILASNDAQTGYLSNETATAFVNMWAEQQTTGDKNGSWSWLRFANEPWEADDSDFYGATLAAIAVGTAPGKYRATPEIQNSLNMLREYLNRESAAQTPINRAVLLWASAKLPGLLDPEKQKAIIAELLSKQQPDGGWSLSALSGSWKRHDNTPQELSSDGYATGLITLALQQSGIPRDNPQLKQGIAWLTANQSKTDGNWPSYSLNNNAAHHIAPTTVLFMNDAATAYAVLSLSEANQH